MHITTPMPKSEFTNAELEDMMAEAEKTMDVLITLPQFSPAVQYTYMQQQQAYQECKEILERRVSYVA